MFLLGLKDRWWATQLAIYDALKPFRGEQMYKRVLEFLAQCSDSELYSLWEQLINEMNKRKTKEIKKEI